MEGLGEIPDAVVVVDLEAFEHGVVEVSTGGGSGVEVGVVPVADELERGVEGVRDFGEVCSGVADDFLGLVDLVCDAFLLLFEKVEGNGAGEVCSEERRSFVVEFVESLALAFDLVGGVGVVAGELLR